MEGQGKRLVLAVALALGVMLVWQMIFPSKPDEVPPGLGSGSAGSGGALVNPGAPIAAKSRVMYCKAEPGAPDAKLSPEIPDEITTRSFPGKMTAKFSTNGGTLVGWRLNDPRYEKDQMKGELMATQVGAGSFAVGFWAGSKKCLPERTRWTLDKSRTTETTVVYSLEYDGMKLTKIFTIVPEAFVLRMNLEVTITNTGAEPISQNLTITNYAFQDPDANTEGGMQVSPRIWHSATMRDGEVLQTSLKDLLDREKPGAIAEPRFEPNITWTGFEHPYLMAVTAPRRLSPLELIAKHTYPVEPYGLMRTDIEHPQGDKFAVGTSTVKREVLAYLGPKNYYQLTDADAIADTEQWESHFSKAIDLGWFAFIGRPLMWLLFKFQSVVVNWGIAIILLTFLVKGLTLFWTTKSMRSMKQMAALAPQMKALQEKYKNDKQRIQAETMALYKQYNVNPIAGCLPIVLQMPVWIALYRMLSNAGELYQQPFIPGWIDDLTNTDPFHILPVVLIVTMFVQARLTPQTGDSRQQKFLQYGMPLMFGVMSFFFPAGLTVYIFTNTCLSALHSIYMNKYDKKSLEIMARMKKANEEAAAKAAGPAKKEPAKKVIDVEAEDDDSSESTSASKPNTSKPRPSGNKKKKRRR